MIPYPAEERCRTVIVPFYAEGEDAHHGDHIRTVS